MTSSPAQTRVSLLARAMRFFPSMAASVGRRPTAPDTAVTTQSALRERGGLQQTLHAGDHADVRVGHGDSELLGGVLVPDRHKGGGGSRPCCLQQVDLPVGGQGRDPDAGVLRHGGGLPADGAGAAQNGNGP